MYESENFESFFSLHADCIQKTDEDMVKKFIKKVKVHQYKMEVWIDCDKTVPSEDFKDHDWIVENNNANFDSYNEFRKKMATVK